MVRREPVSIDALIENVRNRVDFVMQYIAWEILTRALEIIEERDIIWRGELYGSGKVVKDQDMHYRVVFDAEYAALVEFGGRPAYVSRGAIKSWLMSSHKFPPMSEEEAEEAATRIARKIRERGRNPQPFLLPAVNDIISRWRSGRRIRLPATEEGIPEAIKRRLEGLPSSPP